MTQLPVPEGLFDQWLSEKFAEDPVLASNLGLCDYDEELGDFSAAAFEQRQRSARRWAARIGPWSGPLPGPEEQWAPDRTDAMLLASHLAGQAVMAEWEYWRRDPEVYLDPCLRGVAGLFMYRLRPEPELVRAAASRLRQIPRVLGQASEQLSPALVSRVGLGRGAAAARGGALFFADGLLAEIGDTGLRATVRRPAEEAAAALTRFAGHLEDLASSATGSWAIGEERYTALLQRQELLGVTAAELSATGEKALADLDREITEVARRLDPGAGSWQAVSARLRDSHPSEPADLLEAYTAACDRARAFLVERGLVTLPEGEHCSVEPSPEFLRPVLAVASYEAPPPFAEGAHGHFLVPFPPAGASPDNVEDLLTDNSWPAIPTVAVHEAYPGHHWQLAWSKQTGRPLRKVITTSYFIEGWALYAEAMMRQEGFFTRPEEELAHLESRVFRAARIVVDTALHSGDMSFEDAVAFMSARTSLSATVARAEVSRYCAWPTQAASYLTGALELERLRDRWLSEKHGSLRQFHDKVAASPGLPLPLAARELFSGSRPRR